MATELILVRHGNGFMPADPVGREAIAAMPYGKEFKATIRQPRNPLHHRKLWALLTVVWEAQSAYPTKETLLDALKIATGYCTIYKLHGREVIKPSSIAFCSMDQQSFSEWYERAVAIILRNILPKVQHEDLERQVWEILDGRSYS